MACGSGEYESRSKIGGVVADPVREKLVFRGFRGLTTREWGPQIPLVKIPLSKGVEGNDI